MSNRRLAAAAVSALAGTIAAGIAVAPGAHASAATPHASAVTPASVPVSVGKVYVPAAGGENPLPGLYGNDGSVIHLPSEAATHIQFSPDGSRLLYMDEHRALITVRSDGTDKIVIGTGYDSPTWAAGGTLIVATHGYGQIVTIPALGGSETAIPMTAGCDFANGGAGDWVIWVCSQGDASQIQKYNVRTGQRVNLTMFRGSGGGGSPFVRPVLSPDGHWVAYTGAVRVGDPEFGNGFFGRDIFVIPADGSASATGEPGTVQVTHGLQNGPFEATYLNSDFPSWSPDGSKLGYYSTWNGHMPDAGNPKYVPSNNLGATPTDLGAFTVPKWNMISGGPVWAPIGHDLLQRLDGADRIATAVKTSTYGWATYGQAAGGRKTANIAVLTRSDLPADALSGSALAAHAGGPLLLTAPAGLDPATRDELKRTLAPGSSVYLLGGTAALSPAVEQGIRDAGFNPVRLYGGDRNETSVSIANEIGKLSGNVAPTVMLATGQNYPDALAAGAAAGSTPGGVVLLTNDNAMPAATSTWLAAHHPAATFAVGHQADNAAKSAKIAETPLAGADRYATAATVARRFFPGPHTAGLATGLNWADALSGGALMGSYGGPLLLTPTADLDPSTASYISNGSSGLSSLFVFGGLAAVGAGPVHAAGDLIGPAGAERVAENDPGQR